MLGTPHLTPIDLGVRADDTYPGQAYFAGTGPLNETCGSCVHWGLKDSQANGRTRPCQEFKRLTMGRKGQGVPFDAEACKYFVKGEYRGGRMTGGVSDNLEELHDGP